ncbi:2-oxoacid ferredoxin oxidoreductase [Candidatus Peregrinibacteria bacterium]|nr:MAG: 2-oxoacid ferredoxin oxidoreductase [Candidatus Peregrinibacteria bacterium]
MKTNCSSCHSSLDQLLEKKEVALHYEESEEKLTWCSGCGNYGIEKALIRALTLENIGFQDCLICYDIGCNGNGSDKTNAYTVHGLHGRVIPLSAGAALANSKQKVIAIAGDGATFSEGINHLVHAIRNDYPVTFICHNNENYGLTTGQASSTTRTGIPMNGSPDGVVAPPLNICEFILSLSPTFVARGFSGDVPHTTEILREALLHPGFSFVEIMQVCPTYNKSTYQEWFWDRIFYVDSNRKEVSDREVARKQAQNIEEHIALGVLYKKPIPSFLERIPQRNGKTTTLVQEVKHYDISNLLLAFI